MSAVFGAISAVSAADWPGAWLAGIASVVFVGWVGAERLWYLRAFTDRPMTAREALRASLRYFGRFTRLLLLMAVVMLPLTVPWFIAVWRAARSGPGAPADGLGFGLLIYITVITLVLDFALTFVTPALVYSTTSASHALRVGLRLLRATWPHAAPYVLLPPLAVVLLTRASTGPVGVVGAAVVVVTALLSLLARGATCAYYLRIVTPVGPNGALAEMAPARRRAGYTGYGGHSEYGGT